MPNTIVELSNGEELEFPAGASEELIERETKKYALRWQQGEATRAGERAGTVAKVAGAAAKVVEGFTLPGMGRALGTAGRVYTGEAEDFYNWMASEPNWPSVRPETFRNTMAALEGRPGPDEIAQTEAAQKGDLGAQVKLGVRDGVRSLPAMGAGLVAAAAGMPMPLALGAPMGLQAYGETGSVTEGVKAGTLGALLPTAGGVGRVVAGGALKEVVKRGWLSAESGVAQKAVELAASQAGMQALMEASKLPEYAAAAPEERKGMLVRSLAANLALALADAPALKGGEASATRLALEGDAAWLVGEMAKSAPIEGMSVEQLAAFGGDAETGYAWGDAARSLLSATTNAREVRTSGVPDEIAPVVADVRGIEPPTTGKARTLAQLNAKKVYERLKDPLDWFEDSGTTLRRLKAGETSEYAALWREAQKKYPDLFAEEGLNPDDAANLFSRTHQTEMDPEALLEGLVTAKARRKGNEEAFYEERRQMDRDGAFLADVKEGAGRAADKMEDLLVEEVDPGDVFTVRGREARIAQVRTRPGDETMVDYVVVESEKYGKQVVRVGEALKIDKGSLKRATKVEALPEMAFSAGKGKTIDEVLEAAGKSNKVESRLGQIDSRVARVLQEGLKVDVSKYEHSVDNFAVQHILNTHGDSAKEARRGQIAVTAADIRRIPEIVRNPDAIEFVGKNRHGRDLVRYTKRFNGTTFYVEEARTGRKTMAAETMFKRPTGANDASKPAPSQTPGALSRPANQDGSAIPEAVASVEQALLPRTVEGQTAPPAGEPVSLAEIRQYLSQALDIPVRMGRMRAKALGYFTTKPETIRMRALNDIATVAHEVGHYLHKITLGGMGADFGKSFDGELMALGQVTSKKSYSAHQVRMEGVAEFVREWLTDRAHALAKAPQFTQYFEGKLQGEFPEVWTIMTRARGDLGRYIRQPAMMKLESRIDRNGSKGKVSVGQRWREFYEGTVTDWVNELRPLERAMEEARRFGLGEQDARLVTDLAVNHIGGWRGKVEYALHQRQTDLAGNDVGPSLGDILKPVADLNEFGRYLVGRRELELLGRRIKTGMDARDAAELRVELGKLDGTYQQAAKDLGRWQEQQLKLLVESGVLSGEQFLKMRDLNRDYIPFYRVMESAGGKEGGARAGGGFVNVGQGVRALKGSDRRYVEPLESVVKNAYMLREIAERNKVGRAFVDAIAQVEGGGRIAEKVGVKLKGTAVKGEEVVAAIERAGIVFESLGVDAQDLATTIYRAGKQNDPRNGIFTVWREGKEESWQLSDPELYRALTLGDSLDAQILAKGPLMKSGAMFTRTLRAGATLSLEFMARNPFRDQVTAGVYSRYGFVPFFDGFRGIVSAVTKDAHYWDWVKSGGRYSDFVAMDRTDLQAKLVDVARDKSAAQKFGELANPRNVLKNLQKFSEVMEQATRISAYRRAKKGGATDVEAANEAKDATLNFARAGFKGKTLNMLVAFFNAKVQDFSKFGRAHQERPLQTMLKAGLLITAPSVLAWWLGKDDEEIQNLPEWRKNYFWNVNVADLAAIAGVEMEDRVLSFPKPFLLGQIYGSSVERGLDYVNKRDPSAVKKWFAAVMRESPIPVTWESALSTFVPTALRPAWETESNYSMFRGQAIEGQGMQALPPELRYSPQSSLFSRKVAEMVPWTGLSPLKVDNLVRGYFGGLGKYGTDAVDFALTSAAVMEVPEGPAKGVWERPLLKAFAKSPYEASVYVDRFYKGMELAEERIAGVQHLMKSGDPAGAKDFARKYGNEEAWYLQRAGGRSMITELRQQRENLGTIVRAMHVVQNSREMTPAVKRERLVELSRARDRMAEAMFKGLISPADQKRVF